MLDELAVRNLGVIADAHLEPGPGLTVVTGETGTGKTLLLGALRLLLGGQARTDLVGPHGGEARVEGRFLIGSDELAVGRRIGGARSRAYLDGSMASARAVEERTEGLVEIVGQHDQLLLTRSAELRRLLDRSVEPAVLDAYRTAWARLVEVRGRIEAVGGDRRALERELDLVRYQVEEIERAGFTPGDDATLETKLSRLRHVEELQERLSEARAALDRADAAIGEAVDSLRRVAGLDVDAEGLAMSAESAAALVSELISDARQADDLLEADPSVLADLEQRAALLAELRRKYGASLDEVLEFAMTATARRDELDALLGGADELERELVAAAAAVDAAGAGLRAARAETADRIAAATREHLIELGFDDPTVLFDITAADPGPSGADRVDLRFASDARLTAGPISRVASGGELSRLVLSLRLAAGAGQAAVVAFDEIDAGVGGATALAMGRKLAALARDRQVLCVTHLPQVAAFADTHVVVERDGPEASVAVVDGEARLEELSRMLSGLPESDRGREHAEELRRLAAAERA